MTRCPEELHRGLRQMSAKEVAELPPEARQLREGIVAQPAVRLGVLVHVPERRPTTTP